MGQFSLHVSSQRSMIRQLSMNKNISGTLLEFTQEYSETKSPRIIAQEEKEDRFFLSASSHSPRGHSLFSTKMELSSQKEFLLPGKEECVNNHLYPTFLGTMQRSCPAKMRQKSQLGKRSRSYNYQIHSRSDGNSQRHALQTTQRISSLTKPKATIAIPYPCNFASLYSTGI